MPKLRHPVVKLLVDREDPVAEIITYARHVGDMLTNNDWVKSPVPALSVLAAHNDALFDAEAKVLERGNGLAAARDGKLSKVLSDLDMLRACVQVVVDDNVPFADEIAASCGMKIGRTAKRNKAPLSAVKAKVLGAVKLIAKAAARSAAYLWEMSSDGGVTWVVVGLTTLPDTTVSGLTRGEVYKFRVTVTVGRVTFKPSDPVEFRVP